MAYLTDMEVAQAMLAASSANFTSPKFIAEQVRLHDTKWMEAGVRYYNCENDIKSRQQYFYYNGVKQTDPTKPNNTIAHPFLKLLIDQKVSYLVGKPITKSANDLSYLQEVNKILGDDFDDTLVELVKGASQKGTEWLHVYLDEHGAFGYKVVDAREVIPFYTDAAKKNLELVIVYYPLETPEGTHFRAELWDKERVYYFETDEDGKWLERPVQAIEDEEGSRQVNYLPHYTVLKDGATTPMGWGKVPFIEFSNNSERSSDLKPIKALIDEYDKSVSDLANNLEEIQDVIYVLKNYQGQDAKEFLANLRYHKFISVTGDGGVEPLTVNIPIEATKAHLDRIEEDIFTLGQGVNPKTDKFGANPSGVALKFLYEGLNKKCSVLERKFMKGLRELMWFITKHLYNQTGKLYDYQSLKFTFNKTLLTNEKEIVETLAASKDMMSTLSILSMHPYVQDVTEEMARLRQEGRIQPTGGN